ncbi:Pycsar system effector family protein [Polluticoccus soli]|uniref:Pycsar system effector family protein n=1 Tax=Polluticoccus soli TaxID=3034150 RepID=UPI0023E10CDA|nr:Pycsar system effector family protein [Flavipsychrobacter sp. JY13-12]
MSNSIYQKAEDYVKNLFDEYPHPNLLFHNLEHTQNVVNRAKEIAAHYQLSDNEMQVIYIAAWFHDTGHLFAEIDKHEDKSVEIMRIFMQGENASEESIKEVEDCIMATRMPREPKNLLQEIMCDADTYHFGTKDFKKTNKLVKKELNLRNYQTLTFDWEKNTLDILENHQFFTSYCKMLLDEGKQENIERARKKYLKATSANASNAIFDDEKNIQTQGKQKTSLVTRGIQTMLRLTSENHLELSNMADGKANILISVNSIIISVILSVLLRRLEVDTYLTIPTIIFLFFSVSTIVLAILATRPKVSQGRFSKNDIMSKRTNLLFFGNFYKSSLEEYQWAMGTMMKDKDYLYGSLIQDIHQLGMVLGRKYRLIRAAYNVFMVGIIVSVIAFGLAVALHEPSNTTIISSPSTPPL